MTDLECDGLLWAAQQTSKLMKRAAVERWGDEWIAEIPGDLALHLWAIGANARVARHRLEDIVRAWFFAQAAASVRKQQARRELAR